MSPWRTAALGGVLATLAYACWLFPLLAPGPTAPDLTLPLHVLVWVQCLALIVLLPGTLAGPGAVGLTAMAPALPQNMTVAGAMAVPSPRPLPEGGGELERAPGATFTAKPDLQGDPAGPGPALLLAMVPWPLLALFAQGGLPMGTLLKSQGQVLALALTLWGLGRLAHLAPTTWRWPLIGALQAAAALALAAVLWVPRP